MTRVVQAIPEQGFEKADLPFLDEHALAERWGVSVKLLQKQRVKGGGAPFVKFGSNVRYSIDAVRDFEKRSTRRNTSQTH